MSGPTENYRAKALRPLVGGTILATVTDPQGEHFGLYIRLKSGKKVTAWILMDEEGNGPGAVGIEENT